MSLRSFLLPLGSMIVFNPSLYAARTFSLIPPTGSTTPRRVISPVMATPKKETEFVYSSEFLACPRRNRKASDFSLINNSGWATWLVAGKREGDQSTSKSVLFLAAQEIEELLAEKKKTFLEDKKKGTLKGQKFLEIYERMQC